MPLIPRGIGHEASYASQYCNTVGSLKCYAEASEVDVLRDEAPAGKSLNVLPVNRQCSNRRVFYQTIDRALGSMVLRNLNSARLDLS